MPQRVVKRGGALPLIKRGQLFSGVHVREEQNTDITELEFHRRLCSCKPQRMMVHFHALILKSQNISNIHITNNKCICCICIQNCVIILLMSIKNAAEKQIYQKGIET